MKKNDTCHVSIYFATPLLHERCDLLFGVDLQHDR